MKIASITFLILAQALQLCAQTSAHSSSRFAIIDPAYSTAALVKPGVPWLYGYVEYESWKLQVLRQDVIDAKLLVGYPGEFHEAYTTVSFLLNNPTEQSVTFYAVGDVKVLANGKVIYTSPAKGTSHHVSIGTVQTLQIDLSTSGEPPCLQIESANHLWKWKAGKEDWQKPAVIYSSSLRVAPHRAKLPELPLKPVSHNGKMYDFGRELLGYVYVTSTKQPFIGVGESVPEALDTAAGVLEQTLELVPLGKGVWRSKVPLAFRYVNLLSGDAVSCGAFFHPVQYKGAFATADTLLTKIWMNSAYTLRLCTNDFLMDGIKRDRLPWAGDLAMSMLSNAYTFADPTPVRKSLLVLGRAGIEKKDINGIIDYSMWWIISQDLYQLYYADADHLKLEWPRIKEALRVLESKCDSLGFIKEKDTWLFIDWVPGNKNTALQVLWWWAQKSAVQLARRMGDQQTMNLWNDRATALKQQLVKHAWRNAWMDDPLQPQHISRHANILAVISGLADSTQYDQIREILKGTKVPAVGTPYMGGFEQIALSRLGELLNNNYWIGMIEQGATTFWEGYDPAEKGTKEQYAFYKRRFAKSLCHAWSAGPAAFLPSEMLGVKPLEDGWKSFSFNPRLGSVKWVEATIPTPHGNIIIAVKDGSVKMEVPAGATANWKGKLIHGPQVMKGKVGF